MITLFAVSNGRCNLVSFVNTCATFLPKQSSSYEMSGKVGCRILTLVLPARTCLLYSWVWSYNVYKSDWVFLDHNAASCSQPRCCMRWTSSQEWWFLKVKLEAKGTNVTRWPPRPGWLGHLRTFVLFIVMLWEVRQILPKLAEWYFKQNHEWVYVTTFLVTFRFTWIFW